VQLPRNHSWLSWTAFLLPALATSFTWPLTAGLPFVNRVAIAVAVALCLYAIVHFASEGWGGDGR
jgi:hypothetical protein